MRHAVTYLTHLRSTKLREEALAASIFSNARESGKCKSIHSQSDIQFPIDQKALYDIAYFSGNLCQGTYYQQPNR